MCDDETRVQRNPAQDLRGQFMMVYITYAGRKIAGERKGAAVSSETDVALLRCVGRSRTGCDDVIDVIFWKMEVPIHVVPL